MTSKISLKIIFVISIIGLLFSGYLSYMELWGGGCSKALITCSVREEPVVNLGKIPACVYGFFMYLFIFFLSLFGLRSKR